MTIFKNRYLTYAVSIIFGRGSEYLIFFLAVFFLTKEHYGIFDFYKRIIELGALVITLGGTTFLMTYPRESSSKTAFLLITSFVTLIMGLICVPIFFYFNYLHLLAPTLGLAFFSYTNSLTHTYILVKYGSTKGAFYKTGVAFILLLLAGFLLWWSRSAMSLVYAIDVLFGLGLFYLIKESVTYFKETSFVQFKRYFKLYSRVFVNSLIILVNTVVGFAFMYSDVLLVKALSPANIETGLLAQYGFCLTLANMVLLLPTSMVQVDIEKMKGKGFLIKPIVIKSHKFLVLSLVGVGLFYFGLIALVFPEYASTWPVFLVILIGKYFQGASMSLGTLNLIQKKYNRNLAINIVVLVLNVAISAMIYSEYGLLGIAITSSTLLLIRYLYFHLVEFNYGR